MSEYRFAGRPWHHRSASFKRTKFLIFNFQFNCSDVEGHHFVFSASTPWCLTGMSRCSGHGLNDEQVHDYSE